jgi:hypothetical protein
MDDAGNARFNTAAAPAAGVSLTTANETISLTGGAFCLRSTDVTQRPNVAYLVATGPGSPNASSVGTSSSVTASGDFQIDVAGGRYAVLGYPYDPLWIASAGVPVSNVLGAPFANVVAVSGGGNGTVVTLHFHTFPSMPPGVREKATGLTRRAAMFTGVSAFQMNLVNILAAVIGAAVLERYPGLRIGFGESGIGWIPYALDRMDFEWEDRFRDLGLTMKPSDYWRRQCKATFQFDRIGTKLIDEMGVETIMWASDYPHTDGVWPESSKYIAEQFGHLPPDVVRKITCENAGKFYGLMT